MGKAHPRKVKQAPHSPLLDRLHVDAYVSGRPKALLQFPLDSGSAVVSLAQRQITIHTHMSLYGNSVANTAGTQVMRLRYAGEGTDNACYLAFCFIRQRAFGQFLSTCLEQVVGHL